MEDHRWWGWLGLVILFLIIQAWRALFRMARRQDGMAGMNRAAERILKERGASGSNPLPRIKPTGIKKPIATKAKSTRPRGQTALPKSATPAVIRRSGFFAGPREPVIQRRR
jgi:hypothetical protein